MTANSNIVKLNIGGTVFQTTKTTLTRFDGFFKTIMRTGIPVTKDESGAIFIDRNPKHFGKILDYMRDGHVEFPESSEFVKEIRNEAHYYLLDDLVELCETKNRGSVMKKEDRHLENAEQMANAFLDCTKKGVIVISYPKDNILDFSEEMATVAEKYCDEFDVYFSKGEKDQDILVYKVRRMLDGAFLRYSGYYFESQMKVWFPDED